MTVLLLSVHVLAAIVFLGPVTAAASLFPRYARQALAAPPDDPDPSALAVARLLHRISGGYAVAAVVVPVFGVATATRMKALGQPWLWASMALTVVAAVLLATGIVPAQRRVVDTLVDRDPATVRLAPAAGGAVLRRLSLVTGLFSLCWAVVVVLMIMRPGSTTGVGR